MYVFRIHIRPGGGSADMRTSFDYCLKHKLLGVGWRTESQGPTTDWDAYYREASAIYSKLSVPKYIHKWVSKGDLVWTRDIEHNYYLAKVQSGWEYWVCPEGISLDIDIGNIFRCDIRRVADRSAVPGKVVACFRAPRSIQEIPDPRAVEYSKFLWSQLSGEQFYEIDKSKMSDIFMMLDDEETEDLVFLYLQTLGWYVVPNSRKADTMRFEYLLVNPKSGEKAWTQVKTGDEELNRDLYADDDCRIFLFQSEEIYRGKEYDHITCLTRDTLSQFLDSARSWLPEVFSRKLSFIAQ